MLLTAPEYSHPPKLLLAFLMTLSVIAFVFTVHVFPRKTNRSHRTACCSVLRRRGHWSSGRNTLPSHRLPPKPRHYEKGAAIPTMRRYHGDNRRRETFNRSIVERWIRNTQKVWQGASPSERLLAIATSLGAVLLAGTVVNVLFHVSLMLAFGVVSLVAAPIVFLVMLSFTAFIFGVLMTAGVGFFLLNTPFLAFGLLAKTMLPVLAVVGGASFLAARLLGFKPGRKDIVDSFPRIDEEDEFEQFDNALRNRVVEGSRSWDVASWSLSEVVDELDLTGLGEYRQLFIDERIDGRTLLLLSERDIKEEFSRTMPLGDRMRLTRLVEELKRRSTRLP